MKKKLLFFFFPLTQCETTTTTNNSTSNVLLPALSLCDVLLGRLIEIVSIKGGKVNFCVGVFVSFQLAVQPLSSLSTFVFFFFFRVWICNVV